MSCKCTKCGNKLTDHALYCSRCGEKVTITKPKCPNCGRELPEYAKFCAICGTKICGDSQTLLEPSSEHIDEQPEGAFLPDFEQAAEEQTDHSKDTIDSQPEATQQLDLYKQLKNYEQTGKDDTVEYYELLQKEKKAYFWNKLIGFIGAIMACCLVTILLGEGGIGIKLLKITVLGFAVTILVFFLTSRIQKITGIKVGISLSSLFANKTKDEEAAEEKEIDAGLDYFTRCVKGRHPGADRTVRILMAVATVIAIVCFVICIGAEINFWESLRLALMLLYSVAAVIYGIWTFKFAIILILLAIGVILSLFVDDKGISSYPINTEISHAEDTCVTINGARLDEYNGKKAIVVSYSWTNTTNSETSAMYNVAIHAYQNDIELEKAYFTDADNEFRSRNIKPNITVELEEVFYLDDPDADVLVEATPWIALSGEVYASKVYPPNRPTESGNDTSGSSTAKLSISDFIGEYSYDGSFETQDGLWVDFHYVLSIEDADNGVAITEMWRGIYIFCNDWASQNDIEGDTLYFVVKYGDNAGTHSLTLVPAAQSPYGADTIYIDGDTDMPFTRDSYSNDQSQWEYEDYVAYYGFDPADYGYAWYNEMRSGPLDEFFEIVYQELASSENRSRLYSISDPYHANLTPDDFVGTWETDNGLVFTIDNTDGQYSIDLSANENLGMLGGWFSENIYNIYGNFCGMEGYNGVTSFYVSYQYSSDYPVRSWLSVELENSHGDTITDIVTLDTNLYG